MKKKWIILLYSLVILAALGASAYEFHTKGTVDNGNLVRTLLIILGAVVGMCKTRPGRRSKFVRNQVALFEKAYASQIGNAFTNMPKERKLFFRSLGDFNSDKYDAALKKLEQLNESCRGMAEQRAISFFLGRNYEGIGDYSSAITSYEQCLRMGGDSAAANNLATCYSKMGNLEKQWENLLLSVQIDPKYANGHNNIGQFLIRVGEYENAIAPLQEAHRLNANLRPALSGLAICFAMTDQKENYEKALHMLVALGDSGEATKSFIRSLDPPFEV